MRQQLSALTAFFLLAPALAWAAQAGVIELVEGEVQITSKSGEVVTARRAQSVSGGDTVATGKTGEVHFRMEDRVQFQDFGFTRWSRVPELTLSEPFP